MAATVMIVDDSATLRRMLRKELEANGYKVIDAASGGAALERLDAEPVDLLISDVNMDPMNGYALVCQVRQKFPRERLPVLFLTTEAGDEQKLKGREVGANGWLVKPLVPARLHAALAHLLSKSRVPA